MDINSDIVEYETEANFWVLVGGQDCDGYNRGSVSPYTTRHEAEASAKNSNDWSDGLQYSVTDQWDDVVEYCEYYDKNPENYRYAVEYYNK